MSKNEAMEKLDRMVEILGTEEVLESLAKAMSAKELEENLEYIARMFDIEGEL